MSSKCSEPSPHVLTIELAMHSSSSPYLWQVANAATITTGLKGEFQHAIDVIASQEVDIGLAADVCTVAYLPKMVGNHSLLGELGLSALHDFGDRPGLGLA
ncbi:hypothetical protein B0H13DRAFT_2358962 [Mycena leptocephala]|nr:hypothetical protein B0H13DRAFT_2358962 [Mycena leptocephala]